MMTCLIGLPFIKYIMCDGVCRAELSGPSECRMVKEQGTLGGSDERITYILFKKSS